MSELFTPKIYTEKGLTKENFFAGKKVLHLGCGHSKLPGAVGVDILSHSEVDVVQNLDQYPWPFADASVDIVFAHSVIEHLDNIVSLFEELARIVKPGGRVIITVPHFRSTDSFTDPTHKHFFTSQSLDYFVVGAGQLSHYGYTKQQFSKLGFWYSWPRESKSIVTQAFKNFIQRHPRLYDQYLSMLIPVKTITWELEKNKEE